MGTLCLVIYYYSRQAFAGQDKKRPTASAVVNGIETNHLKNRRFFCKMVLNEKTSIVVGLWKPEALFCLGVEK
jgi:hypothetical protein